MSAAGALHGRSDAAVGVGLPAGAHAAAYRPDVDGLRAISIALVLIFHIFPEYIPGGFVGVDVFFVISGYLITGLLLKDYEQGQFSILKFYGRRVRRIFPALLVVMVVAMFIGARVLLPDEQAALGMQIGAGAGFFANILFWFQSGYFDTEAALKPMLHLWSLGVEEQFYLFWPLLLGFMLRWRSRLVIAVVALALFSFALSIYQLNSAPVAAFYSPFGRFWELMLGALVAIGRYGDEGGTQADTRGQSFLWDAVSLAGVLAIVATAFLISPSSRFPGWLAIGPVLGAAMIIAAGQRSAVNRYVLGSQLFVFIGLISYPLYLWHWPLISFAHIVSGGTPSFSVRLNVVLISLLCAWLTCRYLEAPIRRSGSYRTQFVLFGLVMAVGAFGALGFGRTVSFDRIGAPRAVENVVEAPAGAAVAPAAPAAQVAAPDPESMRLGEGLWENTIDNCGISKDEQEVVKDCRIDKRERPVAVVWGDSKAGALYPGLVRESAPGKRWMDLGRSGCAPMHGVQRVTSYTGDNPDDCARANKFIMNRIESDHDIKHVLIVTGARVLIGPGYGKAGASEPYPDAVVDGLANIAKRLAAKNKKVYFLIDNPTLPDPKKCVSRSIGVQDAEAPVCEISLDDHRKATEPYRRLVDVLKQKAPMLEVFDATDRLCDMTRGTCSVARSGKFLYSYGDHLSDVGNSAVAAAFLERMSLR